MGSYQLRILLQLIHRLLSDPDPAPAIGNVRESAMDSALASQWAAWFRLRNLLQVLNGLVLAPELCKQGVVKYFFYKLYFLKVNRERIYTVISDLEGYDF